MPDCDRISDCKGSVILFETENSISKNGWGYNLAGRANRSLSRSPGDECPVTERITEMVSNLHNLLVDDKDVQHQELYKQ